jgi:hypothetical protein
MSHLVDRNKVKIVDLGPCECPGKPHDTDTVRIRENLSYADMLHIVDASNQGTLEAVWAIFNSRVAGWSLLDEKGKPLALSRAVWQNLGSEVANKIQEAIGEMDSEDSNELPNE